MSQVGEKDPNEDLETMDVKHLIDAAFTATYRYAWRLRDVRGEDNECRSESKRGEQASKLILAKFLEITKERDQLKTDVEELRRFKADVEHERKAVSDAIRQEQDHQLAEDM